MTDNSQKLQLGNEEMYFSAERALWWPAQKALLLSDLHIGKATHFRKHGLPLPSGAVKKDLDKLHKLIIETKATNVYLLGDLFHSNTNDELNELQAFLKSYTGIDFHLICGNHDKHSIKQLKTLPLQIHADKLLINNIQLCHDETCYLNDTHFTISGHIHPAVEVLGRAKQRFVLPCLWLKKNSAVLPAFGSLTGNYTISLKEGEEAFGIAGNKIVRISIK